MISSPLFAMHKLQSLLVVLFLARVAFADGAAAGVDFSREIKPILAGRCYACHGPDQGQRKADLRLHVRGDAVKKAIVPGNAAASPLFERIASQDPELQMPPPDSKKPPLTAAEIDLVRRWIDEGAAYEAHWSYIKPVRPPEPAAKNAAWARNAIDRFVAAAQEERGLQPAPEADRRTLARRLSFDLLGLPPQPAEVEAFIADTSENAYGELIDGLLASPHYGERMAMFWLDLVRYGDTGGYHSDNHRDVYLYRDYVIQAFNENMPFDRFTLEQLAGDLLPASTRGTRIASGYNRLLMTTEEGGAQAKEYMAKYAADRVRNCSTVWLAATMGCCECHNHKFDPYTTKDFYALAAFFADIKELPVGRQEQTPLPTADIEQQLRRFDEQMAAVQAELGKPSPELEAAQAAWEAALTTGKVEWTVLAPTSVASKNGAAFKTLDDGSILAVDGNPETDTFTVTVKTSLAGLTAFRLEALPDDSLPARGPGRASNGNFVLHEFELTAGDAPVKWSSVSASHSQQDWAVAGAGDGNPQTGWAILPQVGNANHAVFETSTDVGDGSETTLVFNLHHNFGGAHSIGRFRLSATTAPRPVRADGAGPPKEVLDILAVDNAARTDAQRQALAAYYRGIAPLLQPVRDRLAQVQAEKDQVIKSAPTSLVSFSVPPRMMRILPRGNWLDESGEVVSPALPDFLPPLASAGERASRLDLAAWLTSADNPLVARVMVNRLWKLMFGQGLVKTLDDFGSQGAWPTHPELLDWLAVEFRESGWDVKHMLRLMAQSAAYRQSSQASREVREADAANAWLARQARFRIDAEMVRDNALAVSGLLSPKLGGPSVKPYQPAGYWAWLNFPVRDYVNDHGDDQYRRGLYTYLQRTFPHPSLLAFDAPSREECTVERPRSNTPLQALVLLNDPTYVEAARVLAQRTLAETSGTPERVNAIVRRVLARPASPRELEILGILYEQERQEYSADPAAAQQLAHSGEYAAPETVDPVELAAWTSIARAVLNLHETITRY